MCNVIYHDDEESVAVAVTDVEGTLRCELWMSDSANSLKSCLEHERPGYQRKKKKSPSVSNQIKMIEIVP